MAEGSAEPLALQKGCRGEMQGGVPSTARYGVGSVQEKLPLPWPSLKFSGGNQGTLRVLPKSRTLLGVLYLTKGGILGHICMDAGFPARPFCQDAAAGEGLPEKDGKGMFHRGNHKQRQISLAVPKL